MTKKEYIIEFSLRHGALPSEELLQAVSQYLEKTEDERIEEMNEKVLDSEIQSYDLGKNGKKYVSILNSYGIRTLRDLARSSKPYLITLPGVGKKLLTACDELLESYDLDFGMKL